ncbi:putative sugar-binding domain protein [Clostridium argentinense CDC 2741]|uniref:Putative sugar-binding domain protein n=2 Tax=Clostridium argentinense TaxID=29341 RepID=A0A0C1R6Q5_9CLOT|nr:putative sugar-binding domain protein [Clostridium argentinense CDC 2741]
MMQEILKLQLKLVPELLEIMEERYNILKNIYYNQPIGRRLLAANVNLSERVVRSEINFLKEQKLIDVNSLGMTITKEGEEILQGLKNFIGELRGFQSIECYIKEILNLREVIIVPGDVDEDKAVLNELGKIASNYVKNILKDGIIISLTGGNTVKEIVDNFPKINNFNNITVLPARGGIGKDIEAQSNTLAGRLASKLNANYEILHIPDNISEDTFEALINEKGIREIFSKIENSYIVIHGVGDANEMSQKRDLSKEVIENIKKLNAVGEAYGHYFNYNGEIVYSMPTIGIKIDKISSVENMIAVAAGKYKAKAIISAIRGRSNEVLITDEATAKEIYNTLLTDGTKLY